MKKILIILIAFALLMLPCQAYSAGFCGSWGSNGSNPWVVSSDAGGTPSCAQADVKACVEDVAAEGDTVNVPGGCSDTWNTMGSCVGYSNMNGAICMDTGISLVGGYGGGITSITSGASNECAYNYGLVVLYSTNWNGVAQTYEVSNFSFVSDANIIFRLGAGTAPFTQQNLKIHDIIQTDEAETSCKGGFIFNKGGFWGVVYDNNIDVPYPIANSFAGNDSWWANAPQNEITLGSDDALYYEDNVFAIGLESSSSSALMNGEYAPRYVARYNTITDVNYGDSLFDFHGEQSTPMAAGFFFEVYGNNYTPDNSGNATDYLSQRSGRGKVFFNNINMQASSLTPKFDIGNSASICPPNYPELKMTQDSYYFRNREDYTSDLININVGVTKIDDCAGQDNWPTDGRDVFDDNSSPGVDCGSALPGTCTVGEGYWLTTDTTMCTDLTNYVGANPTVAISGTFYKCTSTNVWTSNYTPYTYPHPLRINNKGIANKPAAKIFITGGSPEVTHEGGMREVIRE